MRLLSSPRRRVEISYPISFTLDANHADAGACLRQQIFDGNQSISALYAVPQPNLSRWSHKLAVDLAVCVCVGEDTEELLVANGL